METLFRLLPSAATIAGVAVALFVFQRILDRADPDGIRRARNQILLIAATALGLFLILLVLPIGDARRGQLLGLIGIILSAAIALSSTTFLGNLMAGIMMRAVRNFRMGDFIRVEEHFGRVSERGIFHTEIQTEDRDLTTLPNLYLVTKPVTTIRTSGTIISATVSLGYDVPRSRIERLLLQAAGTCGLEEPFVQILDLGDFSVTYRVAGLLKEIKTLVSTRSRLRGCVLDSLHEGGVEIVSPTYMNTRAVPPERTIIPPAEASPAPTAAEEQPVPAPEEVLFDKAEEAASLEGLRNQHKSLLKEIEERERELEHAPEERHEEMSRDLERRRAAAERLKTVVAAREARAEEEKGEPGGQ
ncbi:MAG TPA: mechanosensitive ion channel domain-containing protein [bacterium]|nr:mechanosensitive ion channel domain-containing protein [bacterium]